MKRVALAALGFALAACAAKGSPGFDDNVEHADAGSGSGSSGANASSSGATSSSSSGSLGASSGTGSSGNTTTTITIYANTDDTLYSMDPQSHAVTLLGKFAGIGGGT